MHESEPPIGCEPLISVVKGDSASGVMEEVLAQSLPSFYRTVYRFLGNRSKMLSRTHFRPLTNICTSSAENRSCRRG
jgi:hypothetical protein